MTLGHVIEEDGPDKFANIATSGHVLERLEPWAGTAFVQLPIPFSGVRFERFTCPGDGYFGVDNSRGCLGISGFDTLGLALA